MASKRKPNARRRRSRPGDKAVKSRPGASDNSRSMEAGGFALSELRRLIRLVQTTGIGELEVTSGGRTVRIAAHGAVVKSAPSQEAVLATEGARDVQADAEGKQAGDRSQKLVPITSPMVGTFYRAPAADADPYVEVGDTVDVGQTVCIVEAMKLMNEIESEVRGRVARILIENAQPVEFGQQLFLIVPSGS